jgi:hypothetical protein
VSKWLPSVVRNDLFIRAPSMLRLRCLDEDVALWIERHSAYGRPVAGLPAPASWIAVPHGLVERVTFSKHGTVLPGMALCGGDIADATVPVLMVVPVSKAHGPFPGGLQIGKSTGGEVGPVFGRAEQGLGKGIDAPVIPPEIQGRRK